MRDSDDSEDVGTAETKKANSSHAHTFEVADLNIYRKGYQTVSSFRFYDFPKRA
jgi:hypothetical protein